MKQRSMTKRITRLALFIAMALIMHFVESSLPPILSFAPGAKMGLSNVISLVALIVLGYTDSCIIVIVRCLLASLFGGNISSLMYSLPAGIASLTLMIILYHFLFPKISLMSISFAAAVVHNVTQAFVAALIVENMVVLAIIPLMLLASVIAGLFVGLAAHFIIKYLPSQTYVYDSMAERKNQ